MVVNRTNLRQIGLENYSKIMSDIDMNGNQVMDEGDKYQLIDGPLSLLLVVIALLLPSGPG